MLSLNIPDRIVFRLIDPLRGTKIMKVLKELRIHQYLSQEQLEAIQKERLDKLFRKAQSSTVHYCNFHSFGELPVLTKDFISNHFNDFITAGFKNKQIKKVTGGSTGAPFAYYTNNHSLSYMWAGIILSWEVAGYRIGDKVAFLAGSSLFKSSWKHQLFYKMLNVDILHASPLDDNNMKKYAEKIRKNKASIIYGYAHAINALATFLKRQPKQSFPHLKGVVCTAELLTGAARKNIETAFDVRVYDQYGCNEAGISAFECQYNKMHLISTRVVYETDENGTLFSTDLSNEGFIMMKYNTTDIVEFSNEPCACKRNFPVIKTVVGRLNDVVVDMDNKVLHASFFGMALSKDITIQQYQVTFNEHSIQLNIHSSSSDEKYYINKYLALISNHSRFAQYSLVMNESFIKTVNGKHKEVVDNRKVKKTVYVEMEK
jgi:phenylacetate-CoA ligase